jgi:DNA polymerase delta subunit 1
LLKAWRDFVNEVDADVITGYNIDNFDLPRMMERAQILGFPGFSLLTRFDGSRARVIHKTSVLGDEESHKP